MGACNLSILSIFSGFLVLPAIATRVYLGMFRSATTCLLEGHKESEISQEEEANDASSTMRDYEKL